MGMCHTYNELRNMSDEDLIKFYDCEAQNTVVGTAYYREELSRRDAMRINDSMLKCTKWITAMTAIMLFTTLINVAIILLK